MGDIHKYTIIDKGKQGWKIYSTNTQQCQELSVLCYIEVGNVSTSCTCHENIVFYFLDIAVVWYELHYLFAINHYLSLGNETLCNIAAVKVNERKSFWFPCRSISWKIYINDLNQEKTMNTIVYIEQFI